MNNLRSARPLVTAVIVTYRSGQVACEALASLRAAHDRGLLHCVVVDNASEDDTAAALEAAHGWIELVRSPTNLGFGRACNLALERVATPLVLFLNPDARLEVDPLLALMDLIESRPRAGIVAPAIWDPSGYQEIGAMPSPRTLLRQLLQPSWRPSGSRVIEPGDPPSQTNWLCGAVMLVRKAMLDEIGAFDPRFFLYFEETDLCLRAAQAGWELWATGTAVAQHVLGVSARSTGKRLFHGCIAEEYFRSRFRFLKKHHGAAVAVGTVLADLGLSAAIAVARLAKLHPPSDLIVRLRSPIFGQARRADQAAGGP